jgi:hypothetical protein
MFDCLGKTDSQRLYIHQCTFNAYELRSGQLNNQPPYFSNSEPIDPLIVAANYFSLDCLEISFNLLRDQHPCLALSIQNILAEVRYKQTHNHQDKKIALHMELELVSKMVTALSSIAESAANDTQQCQSTLVSIHQTLLDWLLYAQSLLIDQPSLDKKTIAVKVKTS